MGLLVQAYLDLGRSSLPSILVRLVGSVRLFWASCILPEVLDASIATRSMQGA